MFYCPLGADKVIIGQAIIYEWVNC